MRKDCHAAHHDRGNVEEVDNGGGSSSGHSAGNSSQSSSSQHTRDGTPQLQASSHEVHQRAGICTNYLAFSVVFSRGATWTDAFWASLISSGKLILERGTFVFPGGQACVGDGFLILFQIFTGRV